MALSYNSKTLGACAGSIALLLAGLFLWAQQPQPEIAYLPNGSKLPLPKEALEGISWRRFEPQPIGASKLPILLFRVKNLARMNPMPLPNPPKTVWFSYKIQACANLSNRKFFVAEELLEPEKDGVANGVVAMTYGGPGTPRSAWDSVRADLDGIRTNGLGLLRPGELPTALTNANRVTPCAVIFGQGGVKIVPVRLLSQLKSPSRRSQPEL